jgi:hypothetical protein
MPSVAREVEGSVPASERIAQPESAVAEIPDTPITPADLGLAHKRVLRLQQIAALAPAQRGTLLSLCHDLLVDNWQRISFGPSVDGAVFELQMTSAPTTFTYCDGYLTLFLGTGSMNMQLCLGVQRGLKSQSSQHLASSRRCGRAAFVRSFRSASAPCAWSVQLFNGAGEQMITFLLPNPFLDSALGKRLREPAWEKLALWNELRARYLGERTPQQTFSIEGLD